MTYNPNPFLEKRSERTTSDQEFVRLFSAKALERLPETLFYPGVHVIHSPPGGGKSTLLRCLTPGVLRGFWVQRNADSIADVIPALVERGLIDSEQGPQALGVMLSCAAGYADLPPSVALDGDGLFRALFNCRVVLRTLRCIAQFVGADQIGSVDSIAVHLNESAHEVKSIPRFESASELLRWAEETERRIYAEVDSFQGPEIRRLPSHLRFDSVLWLEGATFLHRGKEIKLSKLLMIDDLHKLRESQRSMLRTELIELRPTFPIWLSQRSIAFGTALLSPGARDERDITEHSLDDIWGSGGRGTQGFVSFARSVLDRRMAAQKTIPSQSFEPHLRSELSNQETEKVAEAACKDFGELARSVAGGESYREWVKHAESLDSSTFKGLRELYRVRIQIYRALRRPQLALGLAPLSTESLEMRDGGKEEAAAEIFMRNELSLPYYYGMDRIAALATNNVEELLTLAAALFDALKARQVLRYREPILSPAEQDRVVVDVARRKLDFIPRSHTQGRRAQRLLGAMGEFCRTRTFEPNAPYAPGVTGVKLTDADHIRLENGRYGADGAQLSSVLSECVAENLLVRRLSAATGTREAGYVFYLNRTLCACFGLPLNYGGWQEVSADSLISWVTTGETGERKRKVAV